MDYTKQLTDFTGINPAEGRQAASLTERPELSNQTTLAAMKEAEISDALETLDMRDFRKFVDSL